MAQPYRTLRDQMTPDAQAQAQDTSRALLADLALRRYHHAQGACPTHHGAQPDQCLWCAAQHDGAVGPPER